MTEETTGEGAVQDSLAVVSLPTTEREVGELGIFIGVKDKILE